MKSLVRISAFLFVALLACACAGKGGHKGARENVAPQAAYQFRMPQVPMAVDEAQRGEWVLNHFWDNFDFGDDSILSRADSSSMMIAFATFANMMSAEPLNSDPMRELFAKAGKSAAMMDYFFGMAARALHDPNSPYRSDEFYIPVLEAKIASPFTPEEEKTSLTGTLELVSLNRLGQKANDFDYITSNGRPGHLYELNAKLILLFFNNPGCTMCREIREEIMASPFLTQMIKEGIVKVLAVYPDEDLSLWKQYQSEMPQEWINSYNPGAVIRETSLYDVNAIPSLYLLDSQKRVLLKDCTDVGQLEQAVYQNING